MVLLFQPVYLFYTAPKGRELFVKRKNKTGFPEAADVTACLFRKPDLGTNSKIRKDGGFCLHAPASICALVFIDGEAGELGDIAHFLQALARMEYYLRLAEHGCREFFGRG